MSGPPVSAMRSSIVAMLMLCGLSCSREPTGVAGGTPGSLRLGDKVAGDIQVVLYATAGASHQPVGFAVTQSDGSFRLLQPGAQGPLTLAPGEYRCTLESAGTPLRIPRSMSRPETTPLNVSVPPGAESIEIEVKDFRSRS